MKTDDNMNRFDSDNKNVAATSDELEEKDGDLNSSESSHSDISDNSYHGHLHSHHGSGSHSDHSHSHYDSHSHSRGQHASSRRRHGSSSNESWFIRIQHKIERRLGGIGLIIMNIIGIALVVALLVAVFTLELLDLRKAEQSGPVSPDVQENDNFPQSVGNYSVVIPTYWNDMIDQKTDTVKALQTSGGKDSVSFVWASDTHIPDNSTARTNYIGSLMAKMLDNCDIPFALLTGDIGTRASYPTEAEFLESQKNIPSHLAPLWGTDRLLVALGNHDGCWGDETRYYRHQLSPEHMWQTYFRNQALDSRRVFSEDGSYYYIDNIAQKTRFIVLNSHFGGEYSQDGNGWAVNNRFAVSCYGEAQLKWLANVALDMPEGYSAVISAHAPANIEYTVDNAQLIGIINAYCNRTTFSGSYTDGVDGWSNSTIDVDFSDAKGDIIAMFAGHVHGDSIDTTTMARPIITILSAGADPNEPYVSTSPTRTFGTDTETSFDIVTINKETRTIYLTRVGAGSDRVVKY